MKDNFVYVREFFAEFQATGSLLPSSKWAADALSESLRKKTQPRIILEVGPGSGVVTVKILELMGAKDQLVVCEINPRFMQRLKDKLSTDPIFTKHKDRVTFFEGAVQEMPETTKFDVIICAIPFLNLPLEAVKTIFQKFKALSKPEGLISYFEYLGLREIGCVLPPVERRQRLKAIDTYFRQLFSQYRIAHKRVWLNLLPIKVHTLALAS